MSNNTAVLLDFENFYFGRQKKLYQDDTWNDYYQSFAFERDLICLKAVLKHLADGERITVQRAYADFDTVKVFADKKGKKKPSWPLQRCPRKLIETGFEAVQVYAYAFKTDNDSSGQPGANQNKGRRGEASRKPLLHKEIADRRMMLDAVGLLHDPRCGIENFILVTGDSDFIPLAIELRKYGAAVHVIGILGDTSNSIENYCDAFDYFEELLDAGLAASAEGLEKPTLEEMREAIGDELSRRPVLGGHEVRKAIQKKVQKKLRYCDFGCRSLKSFLTKHSSDLGVAVEANGRHLRVTRSDRATIEKKAGEAISEAELLRLVDQYRQVLRESPDPVTLIPAVEWIDLSQHFFELLSNDQQQTYSLTEITAEMQTVAERVGIMDSGYKVCMVIDQFLKAKVFVKKTIHYENESGALDYIVSRPVIKDEFSAVEDLRYAVRKKFLTLLSNKLAEQKVSADARAAAMLFFGADISEEHVRETEQIVAG